MGEANPFTVGRMVIKAENFVGRSVEIDTILNRIRTQNSVSIVGDRRIGKSSLLYHLYLTGNEKMGVDDTYSFIYLSFHEPEMKNQEGFARFLLEELEIEFDEVKLMKSPMVVLSKSLRKRKRSGQFPPIILMDEFESLTKSPDLFNDDFFESLRSFGNSGRAVFVTASMRTLRELTNEGKLTSPFWNIFMKIKLGEYAVSDRLDEVQTFLNHFWNKERLNATSHEWKWLLMFKSSHPLAMQAFSYWLLRNRELDYEWEILLQKVENELSSFFRNDPERLTKWFKERRKVLAKITKDSTSFVGDNMRNLSPLTGLFSK